MVFGGKYCHIQMKVKTTFKYGIVIIESYDKTLGYTVYEYRKPTSKEWQEIILNYIIEYNNEPIDLIYLSNKLCVSKRTIQKDIKVLQNNNLIEVIPNFTHRSQRRNIIKYIGPQRKKNKKELKEQYAILKKEKLRL